MQTRTKSIQKKSIGIFVASVILSASPIAFAGQPFIDPEQAKVDIELKEKVKASCPITPVNKYMVCSKNIRNEWRVSHPPRGSDEYCSKKYSSLSEEQAKAKIELLQRQAVGARDSATPQPGEVSASTLQSEITWIRVHVLKAKIIDGRAI